MFWLRQRESVSIKKGKSVAIKGLVDAATSEIPMAIQVSYFHVAKITPCSSVLVN